MAGGVGPPQGDVPPSLEEKVWASQSPRALPHPWHRSVSCLFPFCELHFVSKMSLNTPSPTLVPSSCGTGRLVLFFMMLTVVAGDKP